ncbi:MAG: Cna B-type domain-containing protein [Oscillospiraceae bacterium]|nr:Cna B-type domain-containing protein [Oscillospiraceae bacterium]
MHQMKSFGRRSIALLLVLMMCLSLINLPVMAEELGVTEESYVVETDEAGTVEETEEEPKEDADVVADGGEQEENNDSEEPAPVEDGTEAPAVDEEPAPVEGETEEPAVDETSAPAEDEAETPAPAEDETEAPADDEEPAPIEDEAEPDAEPQPEEASEAVQAFLAAVAALPETVTEENSEEVAVLMEACQTAYEALDPADYDRMDVAAAIVKMASLMEAVETLALVFPTEPVAKIGDVEYPMLALAVRKAAPGDTITLVADVTESVTVSQSVTIDLDGHTWTGRNDTTLIVTGGNDVSVTVKNGTMKAADGFDASSAGSVIHADKCDLTIESCIFNSAVKRLVQIASSSATIHPDVVLTIKDSSFLNATYAAVYAAAEGSTKGRSMKVDISGSTFSGNTRGLHCSVNNSISQPLFDVDVTGCTFEGSGNLGAGISVANNKNNVANFTLDVVNSNFLNGAGSAVKMAGFSDYATVSITGGEISGNTVSYSGASVVQVNGPFTMDGTTVTGNSGYLVMDLENTDAVTIKNATITDNTSNNSSDTRGAIYVSANANAKVDVSGSAFTGNTGRAGGALYVNGSGVTTTIDGSTFKGNTAKLYGGAIYLNTANGNATISNTVITDNTANRASSKSMDYGNVGGGLYVNNTTGTVTLSGSTRVYGNHTPGDKPVSGTNDGGSADIALNSTKVTSSSTAKDPAKFSHATLTLNCEAVFTDENGNQYTLTQFDRKLINSNGYYYYSGSSYYWPAGYYTVVEEPVRVYLGTEGQQHTSGKAVMTTMLDEAVKAAQDKKVDTVYVCSNITVDAANVDGLNTAGITFARCQEHPTGHMFTVNGDITLDGAHIDGMNVKGDASLIFVPSSGHLTITGDTLIENGKNTEDKGRGGAIYVYQGSLTMEGGVIDNNSAREGGGIYAFAGGGNKVIAFEGGKVSNNIATGGNGGGGAYIEATSSEFGVNGGRTLFNANKSNQLGGGVFLVNGTNANTHHYIYKATFTNNESYRSGQYFDGGAIYIQSGTTAHMKNVYVSGNKDSDKAENGYTAVAVCPSGKLAVYELDGLLSINNGKNPDIGVIKAGNIPQVIVRDENGNPVLDENGSQVTKDIEPKVYLPSFAPGGGEVAYTHRDGTVVDVSNYQFIEGYFSLFTKVNDQKVIDDALEIAEADGVVITGNYANQYGSGIMTNGLLKIGTETQSLKVVKEWADGAEKHENDRILVYLTQNGKIVPQGYRSDATVILSKDNNWSYTWTNLGDQFQWGVKEASVGGYSSEVRVDKDTEFSAIADKYYIATITNTPSTEITHSLVVNKTAYGLDPDASYQFTLKLSDVGNQVFAMQLPDGTLAPIYDNEITFYLKDGESAVVEGLPEGFTYEVTEKKSDEYSQYVFESVTDDIDGSITVVDVVNMATTSITVQKTWYDTDDAAVRPEKIEINLLADGEVVESATVYASADWKYTFTGMPKFNADGREIQYTVEEAGSGIYKPSYGQDENGVWIITNTLVRGSITVGKAVSGAETAQEYTFVIQGVENAFRQEVKVAAGKTVTVSGLVPGQYTVTEDRNGAGITGYTLVTVEGEGNVEVVSGKESEVTITNIYTRDTGSLKITKNVVGDMNAANQTFEFTIEGPKDANGDYHGANDTVTFVNGVATVRIQGSGSVEINGLPTGTYHVTESSANIAGYRWAVTGSDVDVVVEKGGAAEAVITNTYTELPKGSLTITKNVVGGGPTAEGKEFAFTVVDEDGNVARNIRGEEIGRITIKAGESVTLLDVVPGIYTVIEDETGAAIPGYVLRVTAENDGKVQVTATEGAAITVTNTYAGGSLVIHKVVNGGGETAAEKVYTFQIQGPETVNGVYSGVTFENGKATVTIQGAGTYVIEGLPAGRYEITEDDATISGYNWSRQVSVGETAAAEGTAKLDVAVDGRVEATFTNTYTTPNRPRPDPTPDPDPEIPDPDVPLTELPPVELEEPDVPLAELPPVELEEPDVPLAELPPVELEDPEVPLADVPRTGEAMMAWYVLTALAAIGFVGMQILSRRKHHES